MQTLKILEQIVYIQKLIGDFSQGNSSATEMYEELRLLNNLLTDMFNGVPIKSADSVLHRVDLGGEKVKPIEEDTGIPNTDSKLFLNSNKMLLFEVERDKKGIAFQEKHGYIVFVEHKNLKELKPITKFILDSNNLPWEVKLTEDENVVSAVNEIGDVVVGMKAVEQLLTGENAMEFNK